MKNFFSINKTRDKNASDFDQNPYLAARVSDKVRDKLKSAFSVLEEEVAPAEPTEEEKALKQKGNRYWLICLLSLVSAVVLFLVGEEMGLYASMPYLHLVDGGLLVASIVFNIKARKIGRKQSAMGNQRLTMDFSEASKRLEAAAAEASRELGVPANAISVDVLPFHYRMEGSRRQAIGKKGRFDNVSVSLFVKGSDLCLATAHELYRVPLDHIRDYVTYDEDFEIDMWLKPEEHDAPRYKAYGIRKAGFLARKVHGYYGIIIGEREYELLIPCYDFPEVKAMAKLADKA